MVKSARQIDDSPSPFTEIEESTSTLIRYGVERVFEALRADVKVHPGGIEGFARDMGVVSNTVYCWLNPNHGRQMSLSTLVTFFMVSPGTNVRLALTEIADFMARHRENEARQKLERLRAKIGGL